MLLVNVNRYSNKCLYIPILLTLNFLLIVHATIQSTFHYFPEERKLHYREKVKSMFYHAYNGYLEHAYPMDELRPLTCRGQDTWGSYSLTLVDSLDMLLILGNNTEFERATDLVVQHLDVDKNINISVFETNIRIIGGLLSAHMLSSHARELPLSEGWPCSGPLLSLAEKFAQRLLPAFNTNTGMPYGTVNLKYGVNFLETPVTCTAGVGTFILEFGALSRLTGNPHYERVALRALDALWESRSELGLVGNHIDVQTGVYTATDAGIGAGVDSYFEYLVKGALLFQRPALMRQFYEFEDAINKHVRKGDWFMWVDKDKATVSMPIFQSLEAFWPGLLTLIGKVEDAARIMASYGQILRHLGLPPEFYNLSNRESMKRRAAYPLRPEIPESLMYLYRAGRDPAYLHMAAGIVDAIDQLARTQCGFATVHDVNTGTLEDRMESFFLAETVKYLYLIFDEQNFIHNDGSAAQFVETTNGYCHLEAGGWIFNTEAHPLDPAIIYCCSKKRHQDMELLQEFEESIDFGKLSGQFEDLMGGGDDREKREQVHLSPQLYRLSLQRNGIRPKQWARKSLLTFGSAEFKFEEVARANPSELADSRLREAIQEIKRRLAQEAQIGGEQSQRELACERCCTRANDPALAGTSRNFWHSIYANYLGFRSAIGPMCTAADRPTVESRYRSEPPDLDSLHAEAQHLDAIDGYSLHKSTWVRPSEAAGKDFSQLTSPAQPFQRLFLGVGQIVGRTL